MPELTRYKMNYRPRRYGKDGSEVVIASVGYASWANDSLYVRATTRGDQIYYSVACVNVLLEQTYVITRESSSKPLSFAELVDLIDTATLQGYTDGYPGLVIGVVKDNHANGEDQSSLVNFVWAGSRIYKQLAAWYDDALHEWVASLNAEKEAEELEIAREEAEMRAEAEADIQALTEMIADPSTSPDQINKLKSQVTAARWRTRCRIARRDDPIYRSGLRITMGLPGADDT